MIIITTEGVVHAWPHVQTSLDRVILASRDLETLKGVTASLELRGISEDEKDVGTIDNYKSNNGYWSLELDRTTFKLWLEFEAEHYLRGFRKGEFADAARSQEVRETILNLEEELFKDEKMD